MRKVSALPLLGVSALSLGIIGLAAFTPVVNAANTADSTFNVTVEGGIGMLPEDKGDADKAINADDIAVNLGPNAMSEVSVGGAAFNNGGKVNVTLTASGASTSLTDGAADNPKKIDTSANVVSGTQAWGVKPDGGAYKAVPANDGTPIQVVTSEAAGKQNFKVTYGVSTSATTAPAAYRQTLTYTVATAQ